MGKHFSPRIVTEGMVLCLDAANGESYPGSGVSWRDLSSNNNNATLISSPTYSRSNLGFLSFNGSTQYGLIDINNSLKPTAAFTEECWFNFTSIGTAVFIATQYGTGANNSYALWYSGTLNALVNIAGTAYVISYSITPVIGTWYHAVHTYTGANQFLYLNGSQVASETRTGAIAYDSGVSYVTIGMDYNGTGYNTGPGALLNGSISIARIYNRSLTATEVSQNFSATRGRYGI